MSPDPSSPDMSSTAATDEEVSSLSLVWRGLATVARRKKASVC